MKLTKEEILAGARSLAEEQLCDLLYVEKGEIIITQPGVNGGWSATKNGTHTRISDSQIIIRALVLLALQEDEAEPETASGITTYTEYCEVLEQNKTEITRLGESLTEIGCLKDNCGDHKGYCMVCLALEPELP